MKNNQIRKITENQFLKYCCDNHGGKMTFIMSFSTSCLLNERCKRNRLIKGSICEKCYATAQLKMYSNQAKKLEKATEYITSHIMTDEELPLIPALYFRFEAFGDLINETQVINYLKVCDHNPGVHFALWTKNPDILDRGLKAYGHKPDNLRLVLSSLMINNEVSKKNYPYFDKVFTVYDKETIKAENININCGAKSCFGCRACYEKNNTEYIQEKLK